MDKLPEEAGTERFEIFLNEKIGKCTPRNCPTRRAFAQLGNPVSLAAVEKICLAEGLIKVNDFYGAGQPGGCRLEADKTIFIADCIEGVLAPNERSCGSILVQDSSIKYSNQIRQTVDYMKARWFITNRSLNH